MASKGNNKGNPGEGFLHKALNSATGTGVHPVVAAAVFSELTRRTGGATMNAHTNEFTTIGSEGYGVGGVRGTSSHKRIKSVEVPRDADGGLRPDVVLGQRNRVRHMAAGLVDANVGSWAQGKNAVFDASEVEPDRDKAVAKGRRRDEDAIFDYKRGQDINLK